MKIITSFLLFFSLLPLAMADKKPKPLEVGFVYVSPTGEAGWTHTHDLGRQHIEKVFGNTIKTRYVESVKEGADAERVIMQMAKGGADLIFSTSFGFMNPTLKVAKRFPKVTFMHATGYKRAKNVSTYFDRIYEARYLSGVIAGHMSKSGISGYVAAFPIPEVIRGINAYTLGFRSVNPKGKIKVVWMNSWFDPAKEREAAESLIRQGADVIAQHTDSPGPVQGAEAAGVYAIGYHSDMSVYGKKAHLTSPVHNWNGFYEDTVNQVLKGTWKSTDTWEGYSANMTTLAPFNPAIPQSVINQVKQLEAQIKAKTLHPFTGPITSNKGKILAKKGQVIPDEELRKMQVYVEGVEGELPN
ncbi:MAG: BMP family ABC transporter substrate-binding protein [Cellvibrionales bacterium]|nr:BMP family ABC transporter substrate-binding protein [Cellvibrionales bacterium]